MVARTFLKRDQLSSVVSGDLGSKEIGKLIKLLKAQQAVLSDDDGDEDEEAAN